MNPHITRLPLALFVASALGYAYGGYAPTDTVEAQQEGMTEAMKRLPVVLTTLPFNGSGIDLDSRRGEIVFRSTDLLRIKTKTLQVTSAVEVPPWGGSEMVVDPTTGRAFLAGGQGIWIYEKDGTLVAHHFEGSYFYQYLAKDVSRRQVYAIRNPGPRPGNNESKLDIISMDTGEVLETFYMHTPSYRPVVDSKTGAVWVTNASNSYVEIVYGDTLGSSWIAPSDNYMFPSEYIVGQSMVMLPHARRAYAVTNVWSSSNCESDGMIRVFDLDREIELDPISLANLECDSNRFENIAINPLNQRLWATLAEGGGISDPTMVVVDTIDGSLSEIVLPYRYSLRDISVDPWQQQIFVPARNEDAYYIPELAHNQVLVFGGIAGAERLLGEIDIDADFRKKAKLDRRTGRLFVPTARGLVVIGNGNFSSGIVAVSKP